MTHRYQLRRALGCHDSGSTGDFQRIAFGILRQGAQNLRTHGYEGAGFGFAGGSRLLGDVDHAGLALRVVMRKPRSFFRHQQFAINNRLSYRGGYRIFQRIFFQRIFVSPHQQ
jgi:hypothetical protein